MPIYEIISLIGFILGTILHIVLSILIVQRKQKTQSEFVFLFLVISVALWHFGNTVYLFSSLLFGKDIPHIGLVSDSISYIGIGFMPSLLLHTAILFLFESKPHIKKSLKRFIFVAIYLPVIPFSLVIKNFILSGNTDFIITAAPYVKPFIVWLIISLSVSAGISKRLAMTVEEKEERKFHMAIFWVVIAIAALIGFTVLLEGNKIPYAGDYLVLVSMLSSIFPSIIFSYYVYRYNYMEFVLRRSVFYSFLTLILICLYYFGINKLTKLLEYHYLVNARMLESVFVINLVFWFPKIKEGVQKLFRKLIFHRIADSEYLLNELSHVISADPLVNFRRLLEYVVESIRKATAIKSTNLILLKPVPFVEKGGTQIRIIGDKSNEHISQADIRHTIEFFAHGELIVLNRYEEKDVLIINEMRLLDAIFIFPIFVNRKLSGLLSLGRAKRGLPIAADHLDQLLIIANEIGSAVEKSKIIEEKLLLERKMYENEKLSSLGRLSTSVAHEVKNPLSSIKAIVQVMREDMKKNDPIQEDLTIILDEIDRLTKVVNQLLQFAKPGSEIKTSIKLKDVIFSTLIVLNHEAKQNKIAINHQIPDDLPAISADEGALKEIFFNVLHNAIQAMPLGGEILISASYLDRNHIIRVTIADTGPGIPQESLKKIFEPFYTTKQTGTGLGLSIVKKILEDMEATIHAESNGNGALFVIHFPVRELMPVQE
ncbi:MAG: ATP-binding protein [Candidatus Loosdrechtia sp.]|uniref:sensor histidine kinase n=1 Tax=Candidatus Loosdrechtia sp. TaxID=3101272 RepID=UPI003A684C10|nr:MAG: ATP-binding protein [Candidatus Jettenia sp. AMX2]